jgi:heme/copper-type cytochrome/quinol oxidase subunit 2
VKQLIFWSAAARLVFGELMILRAWWAGRTPAADQLRRRRVSEFAWIALPVVILAITLAATWRATQPPPNQPIDAHAGHTS